MEALPWLVIIGALIVAGIADIRGWISVPKRYDFSFSKANSAEEEISALDPRSPSYHLFENGPADIFQDTHELLLSQGLGHIEASSMGDDNGCGRPYGQSDT